MSPIPEELEQALATDPKADAIWTALRSAERVIRSEWVLSCRTPETRHQRAQDTLRLLKDHHQARQRDLKRRAPGPWSPL